MPNLCQAVTYLWCNCIFLCVRWCWLKHSIIIDYTFPKDGQNHLALCLLHMYSPDPLAVDLHLQTSLALINDTCEWWSPPDCQKQLAGWMSQMSFCSLPHLTHDIDTFTLSFAAWVANWPDKTNIRSLLAIHHSLSILKHSYSSRGQLKYTSPYMVELVSGTCIKSNTSCCSSSQLIGHFPNILLVLWGPSSLLSGQRLCAVSVISPLSGSFQSDMLSESEPLPLWVCSSLFRMNWLVSMNRSTQLTKHISVLESSFGPGLSIHFSQQTSVIWCTSCWNRCFWDSISMKCWSWGSAVAPLPSIFVKKSPYWQYFY